MKKIFFILILLFIVGTYCNIPLQAQIVKNNIYFLRDNNIWMLDVNANSYKQLTNAGKYFGAVISPDKTKVAFMADKKQTAMGDWVGYLATANIDGSNEQKRADLEVFPGQYAWSPDGGKIAVTPGGNTLSILDLSANTITPVEIDAVKIWCPSWSPDGGKIALRANKTGIGDVLLYDVNAKNTVSVYESEFKLGSGYFVPPASWSADGKKLSFEVQQPPSAKNTNNIVMLLNLDTNAKQKIADGFGSLFSVNGEGIAFLSQKEDKDKNGVIDFQDAEVYVYKVDSGEIRRVTDNNVLDRLIAWSAAGDKIMCDQIAYEGQNEKSDIALDEVNFGTSEKLITNAFGLAWEQTGASQTTPGSLLVKPVKQEEAQKKTKPLNVALIIILILVIVVVDIIIFTNLYKKRKLK